MSDPGVCSSIKEQLEGLYLVLFCLLMSRVSLSFSSQDYSQLSSENSPPQKDLFNHVYPAIPTCPALFNLRMVKLCPKICLLPIRRFVSQASNWPFGERNRVSAWTEIICGCSFEEMVA